MAEVAADPERDVAKVLLAVGVGAKVRGVTNANAGDQKAKSQIIVLETSQDFPDGYGAACGALCVDPLREPRMVLARQRLALPGRAKAA